MVCFRQSLYCIFDSFRFLPGWRASGPCDQNVVCQRSLPTRVRRNRVLQSTALLARRSCQRRGTMGSCERPACCFEGSHDAISSGGQFGRACRQSNSAGVPTVRDSIFYGALPTRQNHICLLGATIRSGLFVICIVCVDQCFIVRLALQHFVFGVVFVLRCQANRCN